MRVTGLVLTISLWCLTAQAGMPDEIPSNKDGQVWYLPGLVFITDTDISAQYQDWMKSRFKQHEFGGRDRYGRLAVWPLDEAGHSFQADVVASGTALYSGLPGVFRLELVKAEKSARRYKKGVWRTPFFLQSAADFPATSWDRRLGKFVIVEGAVFATGKGAKTRYLNFGHDWKTDFSVSLPKDAGDLSHLVGKNLVLRGWLEKRNGPSLDLLSADWLIIAD